MVALDVRLEPAQWLVAWKPDARRVVLEAPAATRLKDRVAVRVRLTHPAVSATLIGTVVSTERQARNSRVEVAVEADSLDAAHMLLAAAKGEPMTFQERQPRYLVSLPVLITIGGPSFYGSTVSVSQSGCALRWTGSAPRMGEAVALSFRVSRSIDMRAVVRWRKPATATVGLRFAEPVRGAEAWRLLLEGLKKSGAPAA
jgi:PilZ domain-containing protein